MADPLTGDQLRELQRPIKERYGSDPEAAHITLEAQGTLDDDIACSVQTGRALVKAGLHPGTGGDGSLACSGDMLLQALAACAGVTMRSVATSMGLEVTGSIHAEGDLDWRGTLAVDREAPVGFTDIRLRFELESDASDEELETLQRLTERYCVVFQTLASSPSLSVSVERS
ncbi:MAG TPA: OsmC family protein [Solirubrobacterales bacterium]|nr:OsmC family protein [Solirubrobacterales bacterium]